MWVQLLSVKVGFFYIQNLFNFIDTNSGPLDDILVIHKIKNRCSDRFHSSPCSLLIQVFLCTIVKWSEMILISRINLYKIALSNYCITCLQFPLLTIDTNKFSSESAQELTKKTKSYFASLEKNKAGNNR